jgi:hypothetical protein
VDAIAYEDIGKLMLAGMKKSKGKERIVTNND